jgi:hypothetical protein
MNTQEMADALEIGAQELESLLDSLGRPGRLEGEGLRTAYFALLSSDGLADATVQDGDPGSWTEYFRATPGQTTALGLKSPFVAFWVDEQGFCYSEEAAEILEPEPEPEPEPEDYIISSDGFRLSLSIVGGDFLGHFDSEDEAEALIRARMETEQYWPSVWFVSDHGNISPYLMGD